MLKRPYRVALVAEHGLVSCDAVMYDETKGSLYFSKSKMISSSSSHSHVQRKTIPTLEENQHFLIS